MSPRPPENVFVLCSTIHDDEGFQGAQGAGSNCAVACQFGRNSDDPNDPCRQCGGYGDNLDCCKIVVLSRFVALSVSLVQKVSLFQTR